MDARRTVSPDPTSAPAGPVRESRRRPSISSLDLFRGGREIVIRHRGEEYRLRITRAEKLILTK